MTHTPRTPAQLARPTQIHRSTHSTVSINTWPTGETTQAVTTSKLEMDIVDGEVRVRFVAARMLGGTKPGDMLRRHRES